MRTIRISEEVWNEIAKRGKFGETEEDVLRRVLELEPFGSKSERVRGLRQPREQYATRRMHAGVHNRQLVVSFEGGSEKRWDLPDRSDKLEIRRIRDDALSFALENEASDPGQTNAVRKALTSTGYHITK